MVTVENSYNLLAIIKRYHKISLVGTPFPLNFLCGNAVPMRSRPTTPLVDTQQSSQRSITLRSIIVDNKLVRKFSRVGESANDS